MDLVTVINFCTNDYRFINRCIASVRNFSKQIIVTYSEYYYDGSGENLDLITKTQQENLDIKFVNINYTPNRFASNEWCSYSRIVGVNNMDVDSDYILFLDADEIIETEYFQQFINSEKFCKQDDYRLANYYYFRQENYRATTLEDSVVLLRRDNLNMNNVMNGDRISLFNNTPNNKHRYVKYNEHVMVHHYSWVRTHEEMLKKVVTWGHWSERNWTQLVNEEFSREFSGTDFVHGYQYIIL